MKVNKTFEEPDGHVTKVLGLASDAESLKRDVIEVLEQVWIGGIFYDEDIDQYSDALKEFDVDLKEEIAVQGDGGPLCRQEGPPNQGPRGHRGSAGLPCGD